MPENGQEDIESDCEIDIENIHLNEINKNNKCYGNLFLFSFVPLKLISLRTNNVTCVIWENQKLSSTRYCRPIKFICEKDTACTTIREVGKILKS